VKSDTQTSQVSRLEKAPSPRREVAILIAATMFLLLPFICKPFHIDDPLYLWVAQRIREHPLDFFGFEVNWYFSGTQPMALVINNPPFGSFFLAGVSLFAGWSESALHLGMLAPAVAAVLGTWRLARRFAAPPLLSALALLSLPGFLVSATTLMPDVLATALWCWAVVLWMEGLARDRIGAFAGAALLASACVLTKFVGLGLIPLFLVHGAIVRRRPGIWLAVPVAVALVALAYESYVYSLYGIHPFAVVGAYSLKTRGEISRLSNILVGLAFLGGTATTAAFVTPWLLSWRQIASFGLAALVLAVFSFASGVAYPQVTSHGARWLLIAHFVVFVWLGLQIATLAVRRLARAQDSDGVFLACWIAGIFVFAAFANWTTNARSLLPALPAIAILLLGEAQRTAAAKNAERYLLLPIAFGAVIALVVAQADYALARSTWIAAKDLAPVARSWNGPACFIGFWGFQQYMESEGVRKASFPVSTLNPGTLVVHQQSHDAPPDTGVRILERRQYPVSALASTQSLERGSGFYSDVFGPVPFVFGQAPAYQFALGVITQDASAPQSR